MVPILLVKGDDALLNKGTKMSDVNGESVVKELYSWLDDEVRQDVVKWIDAYFEFVEKVEHLKTHPAWFLGDHETWSAYFPIPAFVPDEAFEECDLDHFDCSDGREVRDNLWDFDRLLWKRRHEKEAQECEKLMAELEGGLTTIKQ